MDMKLKVDIREALFYICFIQQLIDAIQRN